MPSSPGLGSCWLGPQPRALTPASLVAPTYWGLQGLKGLNGQQALRGPLGHARCWEQAMVRHTRSPLLRFFLWPRRQVTGAGGVSPHVCCDGDRD